MSARFGIVADDLTGAADAGARFSLAGLTVDLALGTRIDVADVIMLNTASRAMSGEDAARAAAAACRRLRELGIDSIFKKIDSTLRGQPGPEIRALLRGDAPHDWALVCPAFPEQGRTVVDGRLLVGGNGDRGLDVSERLALQAGPKLARLERAAPGDGPAGVADRIASARAGAEIVVADAATAGDLALLVAGAELLEDAPLYAGSAGLAGAVAASWAVHAAAPVVAVVGSLEPATRSQARRLGAQAGWVTIEIDREILVADEQTWLTWVRNAVAEPPARGVLALSPLEPLPGERLVAARLGQLGSALVRAVRPAGLIVTGGDTAAALLAELGAERCRIESEVEPGVPVGRLAEGVASGMPIVLKSGGFGGDDVLVHACEAIRRLGGAAS